MYKVEKIKEGYQLTFGGLIKADEMKQWLEESKKTLAGSPKEFGILVDMRTMKPLMKDAQPFMEEGQKLYKKSGMTRSAVILASSVQTIQTNRKGDGYRQVGAIHRLVQKR